MCWCPAALPTLDVNEGALDKVFAIYKQLLPVMGGYLTHAGELNAGRLELLLQQLALLELETLEQRAAVRAYPVQSLLHFLCPEAVPLPGCYRCPHRCRVYCTHCRQLPVGA